MADESLDEILSAATSVPTAPAAEATPEQQPDATTEEGQPRGEHGHFATRQTPEPVAAEAPAATPATPAAPEPERSATVPQEALHEARQREKEQRERADRLEQALLARQQPAAPVTPPAEAVKPPDFWEDPNKFVESALTPVQKQLQQQNERFSRMMAVQAHGKDTVDAAYQALGNALRTDPTVRADYQRIMSADHPYEDLVQWHKQVQNRARIGNDPDAFVKSELDKMLADPAKKAELLARLTGTPAPATSIAAAPEPASPTNITRLPPSLSKLPGGNAVPVEGEDSLGAIIEGGRRRTSAR